MQVVLLPSSPGKVQDMKRQSHGFGGVVWRFNGEFRDRLSEIATVPELESVVGVLEPNVVRDRIGAGTAHLEG